MFCPSFKNLWPNSQTLRQCYFYLLRKRCHRVWVWQVFERWTHQFIGHLWAFDTLSHLMLFKRHTMASNYDVHSPPWFSIWLLKFIENGSVTNNSESWPTKDHFSSNFLEDLTFWCNFFHNMPNVYNLLKKGGYVTTQCHVDAVKILAYYPLANEVVKGYSNATVRPSVTSMWTL